MIGNRVVISGLGVIASAGRNKKEFADTIVTGKRALFEISDARISHFNSKYAGIIIEDPEKHPLFDKEFFSAADRYVKLSSIAAREACADAHLGSELHSVKAGLFLGTCSGPMLSIEELYKKELDGEPLPGTDELFKCQYYSASVNLAGYFGIRGPVITVTTACSAFTVAVAEAADLIRTGVIDIALVGGADSFSTTTFSGFAGLKATHDTMCAPFSITPGLNLGEGAAFVVLENRTVALSRNVKILGEILGSGLSNDAYHSSAPDPNGKGAAQSMKAAIDNSGINISRITFISAHGTGTAANDKAETKAVVKVFGEHVSKIAMSSSKGATGHCLGAAGAIETAAALECAGRGVYPPTVGFTQPRDGCTLDYIAEPSRPWNNNSVFVKNNFAFGGNNASLVIGCGPDPWDSSVDLTDDAVCISGIGVISSAGLVSQITPEMLEKAAVGEIVEFKNRSPVKCARIVPELFFDKRVDQRAEHSARICAAALLKALESCGITQRQVQRMNLGLFMNIAHGSTFAEEEHIVSLLKNNYELNQVNAFPYIVPNSVTGTLCRLFSLTGHNATFCNGGGASLVGLQLAHSAIVNNHAPMLLCGSVDDLNDRGTFDCVVSSGIDTTKVIPGEGAGVLVLEKVSNAVSRSVKPLCLIRSIASACNYVTDSVDTYRELLSRAIAQAGITPDKLAVVSYNSWDTEAERAVKDVVGETGYSVINCLKSTGYAPSTYPLLNISASLDNRFFDVSKGKNYILTFFNARHATDCVAVFEKVF
jgi:3-oxoacyl-[acyl-carrier-protein] synthase II